MAITTQNVVQVSYPEIPYDKLAISLAVSPIFQANKIAAAVAMSCTPFRQLPDGTLEKLDSAMRTVAIADAFKDSENDPVLAECVNKIFGALQEYISAKGI